MTMLRETELKMADNIVLSYNWTLFLFKYTLLCSQIYSSASGILWSVSPCVYRVRSLSMYSGVKLDMIDRLLMEEFPYKA